MTTPQWQPGEVKIAVAFVTWTAGSDKRAKWVELFFYIKSNDLFIFYTLVKNDNEQTSDSDGLDRLPTNFGSLYMHFQKSLSTPQFFAPQRVRKLVAKMS